MHPDSSFVAGCPPRQFSCQFSLSFVVQFELPCRLSTSFHGAEDEELEDEESRMWEDEELEKMKRHGCEKMKRRCSREPPSRAELDSPVLLDSPTVLDSPTGTTQRNEEREIE
ncbi:hypothetical protein Dimus_032659 [Dionaea muscipula]